MSDYPPPTVPPATPPPPGGGPYTPPPPPPPYGGGGGAGGPVSSDRQLMVALSYLGILALIPYLTKKNDPDEEIRWHSRNGMGLFLADVVLWVIFFALGWILSSMGSTVGCFGGSIVGVLQCVVWIALLGLHIYCLVKALGGQRVRIPVVTDFAEKSL